MKIQNIPYQQFDWSEVESQEFKGETGSSFWQTIESGEMRLRKVFYGENFLADHWCSKGHILFVLEGELELQFKNGQSSFLKANGGFVVADDGEPHRVHSAEGATVLIVD